MQPGFLEHLLLLLLLLLLLRVDVLREEHFTDVKGGKPALFVLLHPCNSLRRLALAARLERLANARGPIPCGLPARVACVVLVASQGQLSA